MWKSNKVGTFPQQAHSHESDLTECPCEIFTWLPPSIHNNHQCLHLPHTTSRQMSTIPFALPFTRRSSSPIHVHTYRHDNDPTTPCIVFQKPATPLSVNANFQIFFARIRCSFSVMARIGKIHLVKDGYTVFHLHHLIPEVDLQFLAVPDDWIQFSVIDRLFYRYHYHLAELRTPSPEPTPISDSRSDSAIPTTAPVGRRIRALQHTVSLPFLGPPPLFPGMDRGNRKEIG